MVENATRTAVDRARRLRALHRPGAPVVLVNVWDAASARVVAAAGAPALATASASVAASLGRPDGEGMTRVEAVAAVERIGRAADLPLSADLEAGYGAAPDDVRETVTAALAAGAVGCNIEDTVPGTGALRPTDDQVRRLAAARAAGEDAGVPLVINARVDSLLHGGTTAEAIARARAYLDAGADCAFVLGLSTPRDVATVADALDGRLSVFLQPGRASLAELAEAGVCRVSVGPGAMGVAYAALARAAADLLAGGPTPADLGYRPPPA